MTLAREGDPYIDGSGKLIEQVGTTEDDFLDAKEARKVMPLFKGFKITKQSSLENLPEPDYQQQVVISAVIGLKLLGLIESEISEMMDVSVEQIQHIVKLPATQASFEKIYQNLIHGNSTAIQGRISAHADDAVTVITELMTDKETRDDVRLKAAQDILDRSGTNADQFFSETVQNDQHDDELRIVITDESGENERVRVDINRKK